MPPQPVKGSEGERGGARGSMGEQATGCGGDKGVWGEARVVKDGFPMAFYSTSSISDTEAEEEWLKDRIHIVID